MPPHQIYVVLGMEPRASCMLGKPPGSPSHACRSLLSPRPQFWLCLHFGIMRKQLQMHIFRVVFCEDRSH